MELSASVIGLIILAIVILLFLTDWIPSATTAVLGCALFVLTGICSVADAFSGFSDSTVILVFGMMVVGDALFYSGFAYDIGTFVLKIAKGSETRILLIVGAVSAAMSAFLSNVAVIAMTLAIVNSIAGASKNLKRINLYLPATMGAIFGGSLTLVGSTPQQAAQGVLQAATGESMKVFDFTLVGLPLVLLYLFYITTVGPKLARKIWGSRAEEDIEPSKQGSSIEELVIKGDRRKKITVAVIFTAMVILYSTELIPIALTAAVCALACVITRCTTEKRLLNELDFRIIIRLGGCLGIAEGLYASGCCDLIARSFIQLFGAQMHPMVLLAASLFLVILISNFISNSTAVMVVLPSTLAICSMLGFNAVSYTLAISFGASLVICTPLASAQIAMSLAAGYRFSDYVKYNILLQIGVYLLILIVLPLYFPLV